jgi:hypothetical protein
LALAAERPLPATLLILAFRQTRTLGRSILL